EKIGGLGGRDPVKELVLQDVTGFKHHAHPLMETVVVRTASMGPAQMRGMTTRAWQTHPSDSG
ncbi:hypothetical protein, partial [Pseudomonas sp.]|uniref:hypothetical protein n=1 Tax=Pseudomonas sp. TaxID=306 RepID=UPI003568D802